MFMYYVPCFGNFSHDFGWDDGLRVNTPIDYADSAFAEENVTFYEEAFLGSNVSVLYTNEHGGSREVDLAVWANDARQAYEYAWTWAQYNYPENYQD